MRRSSRTFIAAMLIAFPCAALSAQERADNPVGAEPAVETTVPIVGETPESRTTSDATLGGPRAADARVGVETGVPAEAAEAQPDDSPTARRGVRHMIVGGATIIVGGLVGDDAGTAISVAGAALLIYGVYLYLQGS